MLGRTSVGPTVDTVLCDALALTTAAGGSIDARSIAEIRGHPDQQETASSLARSNLVRRANSGLGTPSYELAHEIFYEAVEAQIDLEPFRRLLVNWVKSYADQGWPVGTPPFLLDQYPYTLAVEGLAQLFTTEFRARVLETMGTEHHLVTAMRNAISTHLESGSPVKLRPIAQLTVHRLEITSRRVRQLLSLVQAYIADGRTDHAYRLGHEAPDPVDRGVMLSVVAAATTDGEEQARRWKEAETAAAELNRDSRVHVKAVPKRLCKT